MNSWFAFVAILAVTRGETVPLSATPSEPQMDVKARLATVTDADSQIATLKAALGIPDGKERPLGQAPSACTFTASSQNFDLTGVANMGDLPGSDASYTYKLHACDVVSDAACVAKPPATFGGSVCQYNTASPPAYIHLLSSWVGTPSPVWSLINAQDPTKGVSVAMSNGDSCYNMGTTQPRSVTINFPCTPNVPGGAYTITTSPTNPCAYIVNFNTQWSCPGTTPPPPPPGPGGGGGGGGLSGGTIFLIVLVVVIPVYVAAGCIFKRQRMGTTGCESCPNVDFWRALPGLIKDGFGFTIAKMKKCCGKGDGSYEPVK